MASIEYRPYATEEVEAGGFVAVLLVSALVFAFLIGRKPI